MHGKGEAIMLVKVNIILLSNSHNILPIMLKDFTQNYFMYDKRNFASKILYLAKISNYNWYWHLNKKLICLNANARYLVKVLATHLNA